MTDEMIGKAYYTYTVRGWPKPTGWEHLAKGTQRLWIMRAKKQMEKKDD